MIPIGICSLLSVTVIIEKAIDLRRARIIPPRVLHWIRRFQSTESLPSSRPFRSPLGTLLQNIFENSDKSLAENKQLLNSTGQEIQIRLQRGLRTLEIITTVAPLLGLAGTIQGLILLFGSIDDVANIDNIELAKGIGIALLTTFSGLLVSIPSVIGWHIFHRKIEVLSAMMESSCDEILRKMYSR